MRNAIAAVLFLAAVAPLSAEAGDPYLPARIAMVEEQIRGRGISDARVLSALREVPRHLFVPLSYRSRAYADHPLPIGEGQTISQPYIVALSTDLIAPRPEHVVLEVGTGSGYQAAVLARIARRVYTIERHKALLQEAEKRFDRLRITNVTPRLGDGSRGWPEKRSFDRIIVTCAAALPPEPLLEQLAEGGIMILPVGAQGRAQELVRLRRTAEGLLHESLGLVRFVPLVADPPAAAGGRSSA